MPTGGAPLQETLTRLHSKGGTSPAYYDEDMAAYGEAHTAFRTAMGLNPGATIGLRAKRVTPPTQPAHQLLVKCPSHTLTLTLNTPPSPYSSPSCLNLNLTRASRPPRTAPYTRGPELCSVHSVVRGAAAHAGVRH